MLRLVLNRLEDDRWSTIGRLVFNSDACFVLERPEAGEHCRVPIGEYVLKLKKIGTSKFDQTAIEMLGETHKGMIELAAVPGRSDILIHWGNSAIDSEGCLLVGNTKAKNQIGSHGQGETFWIGESRKAYMRVYPKIAAAIEGAGASIAISGPPPAETPELIA